MFKDLSNKVRVWDSTVGPFEELAVKQLHDIVSLPVVEGVKNYQTTHRPIIGEVKQTL